MDNNTFQTEILSRLYQVWLNLFERDSGSLKLLAEECGIAEAEFHKVIDGLESTGYIIDEAITDWRYRLTAQGVIYAEEQGVAGDGLAVNQLVRERLLDRLARHLDEAGPSSGMAVAELMSESDYDERRLSFNICVLNGIEYIHARQELVRITKKGYEVVQEKKRKDSFVTEFDDISELAPQPRGRKLEKLIAKVIHRDGWKTEAGVSTSNEQMDVIVYQDREYYIIECKWEKDPIDAPVIRELHGKLVNRLDVRGIVMSISGFSKGAEIQVEDFTSTKLIFLFGSEDINSLIYQNASFESLLNQKYQQLVTKRKAIYS